MHYTEGIIQLGNSGEQSREQRDMQRLPACQKQAGSLAVLGWEPWSRSGFRTDLCVCIHHRRKSCFYPDAGHHACSLLRLRLPLCGPVVGAQFADATVIRPSAGSI